MAQPITPIPRRISATVKNRSPIFWLVTFFMVDCFVETKIILNIQLSTIRGYLFCLLSVLFSSHVFVKQYFTENRNKIVFIFMIAVSNSAQHKLNKYGKQDLN